jgi:hypothetical protein
MAVVAPAWAGSVGVFDGHLLLENGARFDGSPTLDLGNHDLIITARPGDRAAVLVWVINHVRNALRNGTGIGGSGVGGLRGLAVTLNEDDGGNPLFRFFDGHEVDRNTILVKRTWVGDANLDGVINADDYFNIDSGYISRNRGYRRGDFNYDGVINADDYFLIDSAFLGQNQRLADGAPILAAAYPDSQAGAPAPVPPAVWGGIALLVGLAAGRFVRRSR